MNSEHSRALSIALGALLGTACSSLPPKAPALPVFRHEADPEHYFGSPVSGPRPADEVRPRFALDDAWAVELSWRPLRAIPESGGVPLGSRTRAVLESNGPSEEAVTPARLTQLLRRARFDFRGDLEQLDAELIAQAGAAPDNVRAVRGALAPGTTALFAITWDTGQHLGEPTVERVVLSIGRGAEGERSELSLQATRHDLRELLFLDAGPTLGGDAAVLWIPTPLGSDAGVGVLATIRVRPAPDAGSAQREEHHRAFADALADYERARKRREYWSQQLVAPRERTARRDASIALSADGLTDADASFLLARTLGCHLTADAIVSLDDASQEELRRAIRQALHASGEIADDQVLAWIVERTTIQHLLALGLSGPLSGGVKAALVRHLGSVALNFAAVEDLLGAARSLSDFSSLVIRNNLENLQDAALETRVLSHLFLKRLGQAPAGYDPLADGETRRAQIESARQVSGS